MKIVKKGKTKKERAIAAAQKFSSRAVCGECRSTLEFNANDISSCSIPGYHKIVCPVCVNIVTIDIGGLSDDVNNHVRMVYNGEIKEPVKLPEAA